MKENTPWAKARSRIIRIHDILVFIQEHYKKQYAENTRETIRRQTLHQFEQAAVVIRNSDDPSRPTNSPNTVYKLSDEALQAIRTYGTLEWRIATQVFIKAKGRLVDLYDKRKKDISRTLELRDGKKLYFSPGKHNELQIKVLQEFKTIFCHESKVVYVGDAASKMLHLDEPLMKNLGIPITQHDKLPDVVLYDEKRGLLFLIEAVTSHGPLSPKRHVELEKTLEDCKVKRVYISAFSDFSEFKRHIDNIAWETEVWVESNPGHMIHFNGPKFLTVHER